MKSKKYDEYWSEYQKFDKFLDKYTTNKKNEKFKITKDFPIDKFISGWEEVWIKCMLSWGISRKSAEILFSWGSMGHNWKLLWFPEVGKIDKTQIRQDKLENLYLEEFKGSIQKNFNDFAGELFYCSDRMHDDRLFRCHWEFNNFVMKFNKKFKK